MKTAFAIRVVALTLVAASSASAALLSKVYDFDTPPDINFYNSTGAADLSVSWCSGGFMEQRTFAVSGAVEYEYPGFSLTGGGLSATNATILEARINVLQINGSGGVFFQAFDGAYRYSVGLAPTGITIMTSTGNSHISKDVYGFHTYRLESPANSPELRLYYDGELVLATNAPANTAANGFNFGDGVSPSGNGANATWDYARFCQTPTLAPKTLTVVSALGGASPGTTVAASGTAVSAWVTNSPAFNGFAQYVCTGAAVAGNDFTLVSATNVTLVLTNDATLTWQWEPYTTPVGVTGAVQTAADNSGDGGTSVRLGKAGVLNDGQMAGVTWSATGPGVLAFDWKVSSEADYDVLRFYEVGSGTTNRISGTGAGWQRVFLTVSDDPAAVHTFRWEYERDPYGDAVGDDCGWIDAISWSPKFRLTVHSGSGGGWYTNGTSVAITADPPPANQKFSRWSGDTNGIANVFAASTTLSAPATHAMVTALYVSALHTLSVSGGSGGGVCAEGQTVGVTADPDPLYMEFDAWTGDAAGLLADASARTTSLVMPMRDAALASTYRKSLARVAGCYGRTLTASGTAGGVNTDATAGSPDGTPAIKLGGAGIVPDNGFAAFETVVSGSGTVTFCWRVSSESNADYLKFKVDGAQAAAISGTKGSWAHVTNRVEGAGATHTLRWEYVKNGSLASSTDAGWVDDIVWTGDVPDPAIVPDVQAVAAADGLFVIRFLGERGIPYSIYSNATLDANGWAVMDVVPQEKGEANGLFRFEAAVMQPAGQPACFYRVFGGKAEDPPYLVIDLSGGPAAASYPVTYLNAVPAGGWSDEYKTTRLVMRRVQDGIFTMGSPTNEMGHAANETLHTVTLTKGFYIGVFEVTQKQWERVMGTWPSYFNNASYRDARPVEQVSYNLIRGSSAGAGWPATDSVDATSFMGRMRAKTGQAFDLPTESQWEYACRAGTASALNSGANLTNTVADASVAEVGRYRYNGGIGFTQTGDASKGSAKVGGYQPNAWGLYDMHGNVWEYCLDWYGTYPDAVIDPKGAESGTARLNRGGGWYDYPDRCRSAYRGCSPSDYTTHILGFRVAIVLP